MEQFVSKSGDLVNHEMTNDFNIDFTNLSLSNIIIIILFWKQTSTTIIKLVNDNYTLITIVVGNDDSLVTVVICHNDPLITTTVPTQMQKWWII